ncbi:12397_t:CDS:2 [Racocetra fulgida]|uniref:12397_t:CDS:1 n=1 Tax=Racocetra fulgida TaxID=60492 RepID=A0A9N9BAZ6_9GLOM|nr:12397_t:CDS:2 [Racocetra fulgida]
MAESNLSKAVLEDICRGLGLATEGVKADLVQRIKEYTLYDVRKQQTESNENMDDEMNIDEQLPDSLSEGSGTSALNFQAHSLCELVQNMHHKGKAVVVETDEPGVSHPYGHETQNVGNVNVHGTEQVSQQSSNKRKS